MDPKQEINTPSSWLIFYPIAELKIDFRVFYLKMSFVSCLIRRNVSVWLTPVFLDIDKRVAVFLSTRNI